VRTRAAAAAEEFRPARDERVMRDDEIESAGDGRSRETAAGTVTRKAWPQNGPLECALWNVREESPVDVVGHRIRDPTPIRLVGLSTAADAKSAAHPGSASP
jgi:hypothetical protein